MEKKTYNIDTMAGAGKKMTLVGREYEVLPIRIEDMECVLETQNEEKAKLFIPDKASIDSGETPWMIFGLNVIGERKDLFMKIISKYVFYKEKPMTEELLNEHNWSFKEIGTFLYFWTQEVSE